MDMEPTCKEYVDDEMPAFELLDNEFGVLYEGFSDSDIKDGSLIKVYPTVPLLPFLPGSLFFELSDTAETVSTGETSPDQNGSRHTEHGMAEDCVERLHINVHLGLCLDLAEASKPSGKGKVSGADTMPGHNPC